ncbi:AMP-binding protein [Nonomuraea rhodomycinica]|uniref:AMP-binding protein n=1 Tax=Nonomuraea rhodomycinica TaxID=1712872 RepID=A0A7Y6IJL9_9ACTN|nr:AMP-binding protein [Nonomuraea rhodomycinica]NUW39435.1 AMP-binding protein [Nonomuraea rhodomycinica]
MIVELLQEQAERAPGKVFLRTEQGDHTYAEVQRRAGALAADLGGHGIEPGEPVVALMENSAELVFTWFAVNWLGAVHVPVNTALIGRGLAHTFQVTGARVAVVDAGLLPNLLAVAADLPRLTTIIVHGAFRRPPDGADLPVLVAYPGAPTSAGHPVPVPVDDLAPAMMLFTSGTTGPSKACVLSHRYVVRQGQLHAGNLGFTADDVLYCPFPLFHVDAATLTVMAALATRATAAIGRRYSTSGFWAEVRRFEATVMNFMGATLAMLWKQPAAASDRDHRIRLGWGVPMPDWKAGWEERFGFPLYEIYGLTDGGICVYDPLDAPKRPGSCGRPIPEYDLAIADESGSPLPPGEIGEILIRAREPGLIMSGYHAMPDATAAAFHGDWLRTGDLGRQDADGFLYFAGRAKDAIRRRGENISAYEVEQVLESHPAVLEASAVGVPSELTEEDVKACVVLRPGASVTAAELVDHCARAAARHMVPRYVEFLPALPKTPTQKIEKFRLKQRGITPQTHDLQQDRA